MVPFDISQQYWETFFPALTNVFISENLSPKVHVCDSLFVQTLDYVERAPPPVSAGGAREARGERSELPWNAWEPG